MAASGAHCSVPYRLAAVWMRVSKSDDFTHVQAASKSESQTSLQGPMKSILDPSFRYVPSFGTDLKKTFARIRRDRLDAPRRPVGTKAKAPVNVTSIVGKTATGR